MTKVLVVEDDPTQRLLTSTVLRSAGYEVVEGADGLDGLELARTARPDLIVCDVMMPRMNGYKLLEALRGRPDTAAIPVIMLTAMADRSHVRIGMTAGADDYLLKPFSAMELRHAVLAVLAKRDARQPDPQDVEQKIAAELRARTDALAQKFEKQLREEVNARYVLQPDGTTDVRYDNAVLLSVDIFGVLNDFGASELSLGESVRRLHQAASDSLYLFGAKHLVVAGDELLAVFPPVGESHALSAGPLAVRAAFGLHKALRATMVYLIARAALKKPELPGFTIALDQGPLELVHIKDPLHGGQLLTVAAGPVTRSVRALGFEMQSCGCAIAASGSLLQSLPDPPQTGMEIAVAAGPANSQFEASELLAL